MLRVATFLVFTLAFASAAGVIAVLQSPADADHLPPVKRANCAFAVNVTNGHPDELSGTGIPLDFILDGTTGDIHNLKVHPGQQSVPQSFLQNFIPVSGTWNASSGMVHTSGTGAYRGFQTSAQLTGTKLEKSPGLLEFNGAYVIGQGGGLPGNLPISWNVVCTVKIAITATPSPIVTPPPDDFSITVISINTDTQGPIPKVEFELYSNKNCEGAPIATGTADENGIFDFVGIEPAVYYVKQITPAGYNEADEGECQRVDPQQAARAGSQGLPACPINPDAEFPATGCDGFDSGAQVNLEVAGGGSRFTVTLNGPTLIARHTTPADTDADGKDQVATELVAMELRGDSPLGPLTVVQSPTRPSTGFFEEQEDEARARVGSQANNVMDFPADSFFDIFVEVQTDVLTLHNKEPVPMHCVIFEIPPLLCLYQPPLPGPIELYQEDDTLWGYIIHSLHIPLPDGEILVVFNNEPQEVTLIWGDMDCDGDVDIIDGLVMERYVAGLPVPPPPITEPCPGFNEALRSAGPRAAGVQLIWGDITCSGAADIVDGLAIKRFVAALPVPPPPIGDGCPIIGTPLVE